MLQPSNELFALLKLAAQNSSCPAKTEQAFPTPQGAELDDGRRLYYWGKRSDLEHRNINPNCRRAIGFGFKPKGTAHESQDLRELNTHSFFFLFTLEGGKMRVELLEFVRADAEKAVFRQTGRTEVFEL